MIPKKIFYVPGLISLIGLPILLIFFGPEDKVRYNAVNFRLPSDDIDTSGEIFSKYDVYENVKNHKITQVDLGYEAKYYTAQDDINIYTNNKKLEFIRSEMERLQFTHDTTTVLKITFGDRSDYGEFVWLINQAIIYHIKRAYVDDDLYILADPPPINYSYHAPQYLEVDPIISTYKGPTKWDIFIWNLQYKFKEIIFMLKNNLLLTMGFLLLIFIPGAIQILKKKNRVYHKYY